MREIRLYGSEGGGAARSPYPYQVVSRLWTPAFAGVAALHAGSAQMTRSSETSYAECFNRKKKPGGKPDLKLESQT